MSSHRAAFLNVTDQPFQADPTGTQDSTQAFQTALDAAGNTSVPLGDRQPNTVFVPAGIYKIDRPITIPPYVTLEGTWDSPPDCDASFPSPNQPVNARNWWDPEIYCSFLKGTVLVTDYGRNINDRSDIPAFITLAGPSSTLKGVWIFYPRQGIPDNFDGSFDVIPINGQFVPLAIAVRSLGSCCRTAILVSTSLHTEADIF